MKNKLFITSLLAMLMFAFSVTPSLADEESMHEDFTEAKSFLEQKVSCDDLSNEQLEKIGDYYMEQVHPDEEHEQMDQMMGGEGSESLKQMHILMARRWYCQDSVGMGMMGYLTGNNTQNYSGGMMGMMGNNWNKANKNETRSNYYPGSMMNYNNGWHQGTLNTIFLSLIHIFVLVFFTLGIAALIKYLMKK